MLNEILKTSDYGLSLFSSEEIQALEKSVFIKETAKKQAYYVQCLKRRKDIQLKPEEIVRQLFLRRLTDTYQYPEHRIDVEHPVAFGSQTKRADIVIFDKERTTVPYIIIELKQPEQKEGKEQLKSYCHATGAPIGVWCNGKEIEYYHRKDPNYFDKIQNIPDVHQTLKDILGKPFSILDLINKDKLKTKSLKQIIEEFEDEVLANAGVDVFEEAFKLIFTKLYDESLSGKDKDKISYWLELNPESTLQNIPEKIYKKFRNLEFRNTGVETDTKKQIDALFENAKKKWKGIFSESSGIQLSPSHLQTCVSYLETVKLFNSNLEIIDEAFEYLVNKDSKGEKGQYFTPRYVIDLCIKMLNPKPDEFMIDPAAGSCGFPVHSIFYVWESLNPNINNLLTTEERTPEQKKYVEEKVFAIDFDLKAVRVGRTLNLIAGDGETNVLHLNSLDYERWESDNLHDPIWRKTFSNGFERLKELCVSEGSFKYFNFDILMANPPFAGDIKDTRLLMKYELARKKDNGKKTKKLSKEKGWHEKVSRHILFIERNLQFLKPGGRMAIVLPQGIFNNSSDKDIREFIADKCRILAVVGLHQNTFKPHTGTKTSVLFVQKWTDDNGICPRKEDYPIFFATQTKEGKDNSGDKLYWKAEGTTEAEFFLKDRYGHPIGYHDLFSTPTENGSRTPDGIAEAFIEFAKKEKLSFFV